ncbi:flap endonuclease 1 [Cryptosporidium ryanae]|uniref:flap endonuclease 1 n=1 Tax=Cryptosporidium ryanae TaxID=515981 RepID=UPI003519E86E|nr:flap endonuclease 1 [Cryptosporidium ryanae]
MGIKGLTKLLADNAPKCIQFQAINSLVGKKIAIDASMWIYQFLAAIREGSQWGNLTNSSGESTSHINGMLSRTIRLLEAGIKPIFVFDGAPPDLKYQELSKRNERREKAQSELEKAREIGDEELIRKQSIRTIQVSKQQINDVKKLLGLLGLPMVEAPSEAEAQCAELCKEGIVYGVATEDADSLTFGTPIVIRHLNFSENSKKISKKHPSGKNMMQVIKLSTLLSELELNMDQFIDLCILCGCDYCSTIRGIGANTAYKLLKKHKDIETIIKNIDQTKNQIPENFDYIKVRELFKNPEVLKRSEIENQIKWTNPKYEELSEWLIKEQNFSETRVQSYCDRIKKSKNKTAQTCLDGFFNSNPRSLNTKLNSEKSDLATQVESTRKKIKMEENTSTEENESNYSYKKIHNETLSKNTISVSKINSIDDGNVETSTVESTPLKHLSEKIPISKKKNRVISESDDE